jgi:hypothetical protein
MEEPMSFLDDLFSAAQAFEPSTNITVDASITISPASPFPTKKEYPEPISLGWGQLTYTAGRSLPLGGRFPAFLKGTIAISINQQQGGSAHETIVLQITAPPLTIIGGVPKPYGVSITVPSMQRFNFAAEIDPATNVVYGAAGANFVAISLGAPFPNANQ